MPYPACSMARFVRSVKRNTALSLSPSSACMFGKLDEIGGMRKPLRQKSGRVLTTNNTNNTNKKRGRKEGENFSKIAVKWQ
jgi:hypothetical protein